jgi:hypothetical protein
VFYKLTEKGIEKAPKYFVDDKGRHIFTNSEKVHNEHGYFKLNKTDRPQNEKSYKPKYRKQNNMIIQEWEEYEEELLPYKERVINRIRERYSIDDEIAFLRQKDTKADEWKEYNSFVEAIKTEEKARKKEKK